MPARYLSAFLLLSMLMPAAPAQAECSARSGPHRVALLELYTSEGCSSCPPADRWLSRLAAQGFSSERVIPLALHVDYWDYIGWQDRFAKPAFTARQRELAVLNRSSVVYTPQAVLNGRDFRDWSSAKKFQEAIAAVNRMPAPASITLAISPSPEAMLVSASAQAVHPENAVLYVALYEDGLATAVKAGENRGATLRHDRVVREWLGPYAANAKMQQKIPLRADWNTHNLGAVAFVQDRVSGEVLQAVSLALCD